MPLLLSEVYDAFVAAGTPDDTARAAAIASADYPNRLIAIASKLDTLDALGEQGRLEMRTLFGIVIALAAGIVWKVW